MSIRNFDEAIKDAPVRQEYLDGLSDLQYAWHVAKGLSAKEWIMGMTPVWVIAAVALYCF
jgi:hypothetical protein